MRIRVTFAGEDAHTASTPLPRMGGGILQSPQLVRHLVILNKFRICILVITFHLY